jgi:SAM-dependent methyltransferase
MAPMRTTTTPESISNWDARYGRKQAHRARGLADLEERVGNVCVEIDARLARQDLVRVLELGCGYGMALLDLAARYGERVETRGVNLRKEDGQDEILRREAQRRGIDVGMHEKVLPTIVHVDVARGLPFGNDTFDLVVSQVAWRYFRNKIGVIREVMRVLQPLGIGMIDAQEFDPLLPPEYGRLVEIWDDDALVPFGDYLAGHGMVLAGTPHAHALRVTKALTFAHDLVPRCEIDVSVINCRWDGIKCVYARKAE